MNSTPPILVFRANDICFLGIIRALARNNIPFETITFTWPTAGPWWSEDSIHFHNNHTIPNPHEYEVDALEKLQALGKQFYAHWQRPLLTVPSSDTNLMFLLKHEKELSKYFCLMGHSTFNDYRLDVVHKASCTDLLSKYSTSLVPRSYRCSYDYQINHIADDINFPCIYKPSLKDYSQSFYALNAGFKAVECCTSDQLIDGLQTSLLQGFDLIVQEKILFDKVEDEIPFYAYVDQNHQIKLACTGIKELIQPYPYGTANILRLSWHSHLLPIASTVVKALKWTTYLK